MKVKQNKIWNKAEDCNCGSNDCSNHKKCSICKERVDYDCHQSKQTNSKYAWNIDHKKPRSIGGGDSIENSQVTCIECNSKKANRV